MSMLTPTRLRRVMALVLMLSASNVGAIVAQECEMPQPWGDPRACTWTEEMGSCGFGAKQSYEDCMEEADTRFMEWICAFLYGADVMVCGLRSVADVPRLK